MENILSDSKNQTSSTFRPRKSIFGNSRSKVEQGDPKLLLNGQTMNSFYKKQSNTSPQFYQNRPSSVDTHNNVTYQTQNTSPIIRRTTASFYKPQSPLNKVIISNPPATKCIRPTSVGRRSIIITPNQPTQIPVQIVTQQKTFPSQSSILTNSRLIPSQNSNIIVSSSPMYSSMNPNNLKKRSIMVEGKPSEKVVYKTFSPVRKPQTVTEIIHQPSHLIVNDPNTISELNKLASLNQFLSNQYNNINNELNFIKSKTCQKQVVDDRVFLQRSLNKIDDIFLRQTNQALYKLDQISRSSQNKVFRRTSGSKQSRKNPFYQVQRQIQRQRNQSPSFQRNIIANSSRMYTPMKNLQAMGNSSYIGCNGIDHYEIIHPC